MVYILGHGHISLLPAMQLNCLNVPHAMYSPATSLETRVKNSLVRPPVSCPPSPKNSTYKNLK